MKAETKTTIGILVGALLLFMALILFWNKQANAPIDMEKLIRSDSYSVGSPTAKVTVVEFADFQCPSCAVAFPVMKLYITEYQDKIHFVYRHLPIHNHSFLSMNFAEAAGEQGKFFEYSEMLYSKQKDWENLPDPTALFTTYAKNLGLDSVAIAKEAADKKFDQKVARDQADAVAVGVNSTPTFFINGKKLVGVQSLETLRSETDAALAAVK